MALVLSRKANETVCIGNDITVTVVEIRGEKCRLAITAPVSIPVHRREVYEAMRRNAAASATEPPADSGE